MNTLSKTLLLCASAIFPSFVLAGDEPLNCRTEMVTTASYYGTAQCSAYVGGHFIELSEYIYQYPFSSIRLGSGNESCTAQLPFVQYVELPQEVCSYEPSVNILLHRIQGSTDATVWLSSSDRDGSIVKEEIWVNGIKQSGSTAYLNGYDGEQFTVVAKVTDNDGYTAETTKTITLMFRPEPTCGRYHC